MSTLSRARTLGVVAALGLGAPLFTHCADAADRFDPSDLKALGAALALERAALDTYAKAVEAKALSTPVLAVVSGFVADHTAHRDALVAAITALGQTPGTDLAPLDTPTLQNEADRLNYAYTVERALANAHLAAVAAFRNRDYAKTAASILGVETTHVALLAEALRKGSAYPSSFVSV